MLTIKTTSTEVQLFAPYHPEMPSRAKSLGGKFRRSDQAWVFDPRDADHVREMALDIYGTDGSETALADLRVTVSDEEPWVSRSREALYVGAIQVARAYGRDSGGKLGDGVIQLEGRIRSGGSMKNWDVRASEGSVFEVRDIPLGAAEKAVHEAKDDRSISVTLIPHDTDSAVPDDEPPAELSQYTDQQIAAEAARRGFEVHRGS